MHTLCTNRQTEQLYSHLIRHLSIWSIHASKFLPSGCPEYSLSLLHCFYCLPKKISSKQLATVVNSKWIYIWREIWFADLCLSRADFYSACPGAAHSRSCSWSGWLVAHFVAGDIDLSVPDKLSHFSSHFSYCLLHLKTLVEFFLHELLIMLFVITSSVLQRRRGGRRHIRGYSVKTIWIISAVTAQIQNAKQLTNRKPTVSHKSRFLRE